MRMLESGKAGIANTLRAQIDSLSLATSLAAIYGLGELGGRNAVFHIEELMNQYHNKNDSDSQAKWEAILRAYGRAARYLDD